MKTDQDIAQRLVCFLAPILAAPVITTAPAMAYGLAFSETAFQLDNFSHSAYSVGTATNANTLAVVAGPASSAATTAAAVAYFFPDLAVGLSASAANGQGSSYFGLAHSLAQVVGSFFVGSGESFGFNFQGGLTLGSSVSSTHSDRANAGARIAFWLFGSTDGGPASLLDSFSAFGQVATGGNNFLGWQSSGNISYMGNANMSATGTESFATASFQGYYQRNFNSQTQLTLVKIQENEAGVAIPEPAVPLPLSLFIFFSFIGGKAKRRATIVGQLDLTPIQKNSSR
ncbi:hypothetical protein [[Phormidium] sp. ETS-05]|uniref:hypothetical protein n=1 Tax=[Phormidium] sp. ETS-05 TaxID=222819 RepID=UPI0018EEEAD5|nr:hypothetical protein [[Phormidium] sp. ETS-05]